MKSAISRQLSTWHAHSTLASCSYGEIRVSGIGVGLAVNTIWHTSWGDVVHVSVCVSVGLQHFPIKRSIIPAFQWTRAVLCRCLYGFVELHHEHTWVSQIKLMHRHSVTNFGYCAETSHILSMLDGIEKSCSACDPVTPYFISLSWGYHHRCGCLEHSVTLRLSTLPPDWTASHADVYWVP